MASVTIAKLAVTRNSCFLGRRVAVVWAIAQPLASALCAVSLVVVFHLASLCSVFASEGDRVETVEDALEAATREWQRGVDAYERAMRALAPPSDYLVAGEAPKDLPVRVVPTAVAESELATLRGLPNVQVDNVDLKWQRWKLVVVRHADAYSPLRGLPGHEHGHGCAGFLLVWDDTKREWRSLLPCATVVSVDTELFSEGTLLLEHYRSSECGPQRSWPCLLRLDLTTWKGQLYKRPHDYHRAVHPHLQAVIMDHIADLEAMLHRVVAPENDAEQ